MWPLRFSRFFRPWAPIPLVRVYSGIRSNNPAQLAIPTSWRPSGPSPPELTTYTGLRPNSIQKTSMIADDYMPYMLCFLTINYRCGNKSNTSCLSQGTAFLWLQFPIKRFSGWNNTIKIAGWISQYNECSKQSSPVDCGDRWMSLQLQGCDFQPHGSSHSRPIFQ